MKRIVSIFMTACIVLSMVGCTTGNNNNTSSGSTAAFDSKKNITVISREDGSGTRGAFIELMKIEEKGADGSKIDKTTKEAIIANKTDVLLTGVASDPYAIGYVSMGSLGDTVKALDIDGVKASAENVKNGTYKVARPFNIATKQAPEGLTKDFMSFILSAQGQEVVSKSYIKIQENAPEYTASNMSGKITVAGSSSVSPVMEKLKEAYTALNPSANIELQISDSTAGMNGVNEGTCDIGMASRALKDSEKEALIGVEIALDGIAVVVNPSNPLVAATSEQINSIFTGSAVQWDEII